MNSKLKNIVKQAVQKFYEKDIELVQVKGMEQACYKLSVSLRILPPEV